MEGKHLDDGGSAQALVIGNAVVDETYSVITLPATGESVVGNLSSRCVGGKGVNVATVLARCGIETRLTAVIGQDVHGDRVKVELNQEPVALDLVQSTQHSTDVSVILVDDKGENAIVTTVAAAHSLDADHACRALLKVRDAGLIIVQGNLTQELTCLVINKARQRGLRVILNPSPYQAWMTSVVPLADTVFMNIGESIAMTGKRDEAAVKAVLDTGPAQVVLTRGEQSSLLGTRHDGEGRHADVVIDCVPSIATQVVDATGAGDTFLAVAMASALGRRGRLDVLALTHAAQAAAHTIGLHGTRNAFPTANILTDILAG